jgi:hypothetical protein
MPKPLSYNKEGGMDGRGSGMRKRWFVFCIIAMVCLFTLSACGGNLAGSEWKVAGYVDALGSDQASVNANGPYASLSMAFTDGKNGALSILSTSYAFTYSKTNDTISAVLQGGVQAKMTMKGDKIYLTLAGTTLFFQKKK